MTTEASKAMPLPWYKQFWPWFIMALPATAVVAGLTTVGLAVHNKDTVVRDDWYDEGKSINKDFARDDRAKALGLAAEAKVDELTGDIRIRLQHNAGVELPPALSLYFQHPTKAESDEKLTLARQGDDYRGHLPRALKGRFHVELASTDWRLLGTLTFPVPDFTLTHE